MVLRRVSLGGGGGAGLGLELLCCCTCLHPLNPTPRNLYTLKWKRLYKAPRLLTPWMIDTDYVRS